MEPKEAVFDGMAKAEEAPIKYDPKKNYRWQPNDVFSLSGVEFSAILNATRAILNTPEAKIIFLAQRANEVAEDLLQRSVEAGMVKEVEKPKMESNEVRKA